MSQQGIVVMVATLNDNSKSVAAYSGALGKTIAALSLDDTLHFVFTDGSKIKLYDDGQSCCETRYMHTDDMLSEYVGATFLKAELLNVNAPNIIDDEYGEHEVQFLIIETSQGSFTISSHNEHNGYYGGFALRVAVE